MSPVTEMRSGEWINGAAAARALGKISHRTSTGRNAGAYPCCARSGIPPRYNRADIERMRNHTLNERGLDRWKPLATQSHPWTKSPSSSNGSKAARAAADADVCRIQPDTLYSVSQTAGFLGCASRTFTICCYPGNWRGTPIGSGSKGLRVRGSDILAFLDSRREGGPRPKGTFKHLPKLAGTTPHRKARR